MKNIKVLGNGCTKCLKTAEIIEKIAAEQNCQVTIIKETNPEVMMAYDVMNTPAVVINDKLVHSGSIPNQGIIISWLNEK